jgi:hypothetical protein
MTNLGLFGNILNELTYPEPEPLPVQETLAKLRLRITDKGRYQHKFFKIKSLCLWEQESVRL